MPLKLYRRKGSEVWSYRGTIAGRRLRGSTKTESKEIAGRVVNEIERRHWKGALDGPESVLTFAQAALLYRQARKSDRFLRKIEDHWKDTPIRQINAGAIRQSCFVLYPSAGPATWNRQVIVPTQAIINHASEMELCPRIKVKRFPVPKKHKEPATWEWIQAFMAAAVAPPANNYRLAALACFMFLTGARVSEALAIDWSDVDLKNARALIRQTKVGSERRPYLPPELIAALANIPGEREGPVFRFRSRSNCKTQWAGAIKRAGIRYLSYHACRHGAATAALEAGLHPVTVAKLFGWKTPALVLSTYGHAMEDDSVVCLLTGAQVTPQRRKHNAVK